MRRATAATVVALCLAGCGSSTSYLNGQAVEQAIDRSFLAQRAIRTAVTCPPRIPQENGHSFQCSAHFDVGSYTIPVTEVDGKGHVRWNTRAPVALLNISKVTSAIRRSVLTQRDVHSTVTCPQRVLQQAGLTFTCMATVRAGTSKVKPGTYPFTVTESNSAGDVAYIGRRS